MLTRIDHVAIAVPRLEQGIDAYTRLGFAAHPGGGQPRRSTGNAIAFFGDDYLELVSPSRCSAVWTPPPASWPPTGCRHRFGGVRNTGEQAMPVRPDEAGGAYIGFVGPA